MIYQPRRPFVWSKEGPVPAVGVCPLRRRQSKSSLGLLVHPQKPFSKSQSMFAEGNGSVKILGSYPPTPPLSNVNINFLHSAIYWVRGEIPWEIKLTFRDATTCLPAKWCLRNDSRNFILMTRHYPDLGRQNLLQPFRRTTHIRLVTHHQYEISAPGSWI